MFSIFLDIAVILFLGATIFYTYFLNNRLVALQKNKAELQNILSGFSKALNTAQASIGTLQNNSQNAVHILHENVKEAQELREDLKHLIERGNEIADRLEDKITKSRLLSSSQSPHLQEQSNVTRIKGFLDKNVETAKEILPKKEGSSNTKAIEKLIENLRKSQ